MDEPVSTKIQFQSYKTFYKYDFTAVALKVLSHQDWMRYPISMFSKEWLADFFLHILTDIGL